MTIWRNKKNGNLYRVLHHAVDCTNVRDGQAVIVYCPDDRPDFICVREKVEFEAKFIPEEALNSMKSRRPPTDAGGLACHSNGTGV